MKSETEYETEKHGDVDVYKATTNVTYSKEELEEAISYIFSRFGVNFSEIIKERRK